MKKVVMAIIIVITLAVAGYNAISYTQLNAPDPHEGHDHE